MKKLSQKARKVLSIVVLIILLIILVCTVIGLIKTIRKNNEIQTINIEANNDEEPSEEVEETTGEEINIEDLEEFKEENTVVDNKESSAQDIKDNSKSISDKKYYIKVNYGANVVTIYTKDENGEYTVPVKAMVCSTGSATPKSGTYGIKGRWTWLGLFGNVYGHYSTQIVGNILFHSVPYLEKGNPGSLEYWEYDKLGTTASMGCIRLTVRDAKWIFNNVSSGTLVEFYSSSNPGPLGKPSAQKISGNTKCRDWDPTDTAPGNPWNTYKEDNKNNVNNSNDKNTNTNNSNSNTSKNNTVNENTNTNTGNNINNNTNTNTGNNTNTSTGNNTINNNIDNNTNTNTNNNTVDNSNIVNKVNNITDNDI